MNKRNYPYKKSILGWMIAFILVCAAALIYLGYPIWWGEEPRIIDTFLESYEFSGKTIVPFCTSGGSALAEWCRKQL